MIWNKMEKAIWIFALYFYFQRESCFHWRRRELSEKVVIAEEKTDGIGNLEDLPRLAFIDKEW